MTDELASSFRAYEEARRRLTRPAVLLSDAAEYR
jgi:hypothetical protein